MALENSNTNTSAPTWSWIQAWLVCPSHHATLVVVFTSATAHFSFYVSLILNHSFESICVNLHLSRILVGNYLCPFEFLIGIISMYSRYSHHPHHLNCSVRSASRESPHLQSISVITHLSTIEFIFQAHKFVLKEGWFSMLGSIGSWDSRVAQGFILRGRPVAKLPKVSRSRAREGWIWGGVWLAKTLLDVWH